MYVFKNNIRIKITYDLHLITDGLAPGKFPSCTPWNIGCWKGSWCLSSFLGKAPLINLVLVLPFFISLSLKCNEHSTLLTFRTKDSLPTNSTHFFCTLLVLEIGKGKCHHFLFVRTFHKVFPTFWISKIYWSLPPQNFLVYILCTIMNCAIHFIHGE